jgi:tetratricopeptide (TPR) repeat protein
MRRRVLVGLCAMVLAQLAGCRPWSRYSSETPWQLVDRADAAALRGRYEEAHRYLDGALRCADRTSPTGRASEWTLLEIYRHRASVYWASDEIEDGEEFLERVALTQFPGDPQLQEYHAIYLWTLVHPLEAEKAAQEAWSADPRRCLAWLILAKRWCEDVETCDLPPRTCRDQAVARLEEWRNAR